MNCPHCGKPYFETSREVKFTEAEIARFWKHVTKSDGCWICDGNPSHTYSRILIQRKRWLGHVLSWVISNGPVPHGLKILHQCDNPRCVRPDHLVAGTQSRNMAEMVSRNRNKPRKGSSNGFSKLDDEKVLYIRNSIHNGSESIETLASKFEVTFQCVYRIAIGKAWLHVGGPLIEKHSTGHMTERAVIEARQMFKDGESVSDIAKRFGVHQSYMSRCIRAKRWRAIK